MSEKKPYDPVNDPVPGVDQIMRAEELKSALPLGDPLPPPVVPSIEPMKTVFNKFGITVKNHNS